MFNYENYLNKSIEDIKNNAEYVIKNNKAFPLIWWTYETENALYAFIKIIGVDQKEKEEDTDNKFFIIADITKLFSKYYSYDKMKIFLKKYYECKKPLYYAHINGIKWNYSSLKCLPVNELDEFLGLLIDNEKTKLKCGRNKEQYEIFIKLLEDFKIISDEKINYWRNKEKGYNSKFEKVYFDFIYNKNITLPKNRGWEHDPC